MNQVLRIVSEEQVKDLYDPATSWAVVEKAYREFGATPAVQSQPPVMLIGGGPDAAGEPITGQFRVKGAVVPSEGVAGAYLSSRGHAKVYLWSTETLAPIALIASDWLSKRRVALTVGVGIRMLAKAHINQIALFGAGQWARQTCELLAEEWSDAKIAVVAAHIENATAFADGMPENVVAVADGRAAARGADVMVTLTNTRGPIIHQGWLEAGALLLSMGSPHEVDVEVLRECDALFVDDLPYARFQGDIHAWLDRGDIDEAELHQRLRGSIGQVLAGTSRGRTSEAERLLAVVQGLTICDVALAKTMLDRAIAANVGRTVAI